MDDLNRFRRNQQSRRLRTSLRQPERRFARQRGMTTARLWREMRPRSVAAIERYGGNVPAFRKLRCNRNEKTSRT